ncbi:putative cytochrome c oxidase polypeptide iv mitochondrial precursor [Papiliotrema laurentii]|uniref:Cytochrome c oxidase subunit 4, mitochondrial n=1 Tax=Papiliotrema laurentii TaxID=5418 RepID=A0AAD9FLU3_PAPLA|nr:putative cytochrome c oxidase polypeptide iv mitochondrial precursor [Papiliotrema laurentii]
MASVFRSFRAIKAIPKPAFRQQTPVFRTFASSTIVKAGGPAPPQLYGPGGKAGEIPTDEQQATGLERFELLGDLHGVDVFDLNPIEMTRMGTLDDPISIYTLQPDRIVGCTGFPADSHDTIWLACNVKKEKHRCPECGCVYKLDFKGDPALLAGDHHH